MFTILRARLAHSKRWISHFGICLLAGASLVAALAPAGAAARPALASRQMTKWAIHLWEWAKRPRRLANMETSRR